MERENVDVVVPLSEHAVPLAPIVAMEFEKSLCPVMMHNVKSEKEGFYVAHYTSCKDGELRMIALPRRSLHGEESALMIDITVDELDHVDAVAGILKRAKINDQSLIAIQLSRDTYLKLTNNKQGIRVIKVFNII